jgi:hypothetical protein
MGWEVEQASFVQYLLTQMLVASTNKQNQVCLVHMHMLLGMQKITQKKVHKILPHMLAKKKCVCASLWTLCACAAQFAES